MWKAILERYRASKPASRVAAGGLIVTALVSGGLFAAVGLGKPAGPIHTDNSTLHGEAIDNAATTNDVPVSEVLPQANSATLNMAISALLQGEMTQALGLYKQLHLKHPRNRSFALSVQILEGKVGR